LALIFQVRSPSLISPLTLSPLTPFPSLRSPPSPLSSHPLSSLLLPSLLSPPSPLTSHPPSSLLSPRFALSSPVPDQVRHGPLCDYGWSAGTVGRRWWAHRSGGRLGGQTLEHALELSIRALQSTEDVGPRWAVQARGGPAVAGAWRGVAWHGMRRVASTAKGKKGGKKGRAGRKRGRRKQCNQRE